MSRGGRLGGEKRVDAGRKWALGRVHLGVFQPDPQLAATGSIHVLFHGELVNEAELRSDLVDDGNPPATGAAAIIERLYRLHKQRLGRLLNGAFCAAIVDENSGALT